MTIGEFREWCRENGIADDALLTVYDAEGCVMAKESGQVVFSGDFEVFHIEEESLEVVSDEGEEFVQINLVQLREGQGL